MNVESLVSSIIVAVIGLAIVAVIVSQKANTSDVIKSSAGGLAGVISAAVSPVTGGGGQGITIPTSASSGSTFTAAFN